MIIIAVQVVLAGCAQLSISRRCESGFHAGSRWRRATPSKTFSRGRSVDEQPEDSSALNGVPIGTPSLRGPERDPSGSSGAIPFRVHGVLVRGLCHGGTM